MLHHESTLHLQHFLKQGFQVEMASLQCLNETLRSQAAADCDALAAATTSHRAEVQPAQPTPYVP